MTTATSPTQLPHPREVRVLVEDLVGRDVEVAPASPVDLSRSPGPAAAVYVDDALSTVAVVVLDFELYAALGASIGLLPPGAVEAAVEDRETTPVLQENAHEVLNVMAALFNAEGRPHVKLHSTHAPGSVPHDVLALAGVAGSRLDLRAEVARYGRGALSVVLV